MPDQPPALDAEKLTAYVPVSQELLAGGVPDLVDVALRRTPAEWAAIEAKRKAENARRLVDDQARHAAARAQVDGKLAAVLDMHGPQLPDYMLWPVCCGCEYSGYDADPPEWPCSTWALIADDTR